MVVEAVPVPAIQYLQLLLVLVDLEVVELIFFQLQDLEILHQHHHLKEILVELVTQGHHLMVVVVEAPVVQVSTTPHLQVVLAVMVHHHPSLEHQ